MIKEGSPRASLDLVGSKDQWWTVNLKESNYGNIKIKGSFKYAILDTGISLIGLEQSSYDLIEAEIKKVDGSQCFSGLGCALPHECEYYTDSWPLQDLVF